MEIRLLCIDVRFLKEKEWKEVAGRKEGQMDP